ncbi:hypothetical protein GLAREA_11379 [Glarea lozoyensis ATCC 20868]|uniref:Apple domain-containing protein n=1 Tax=Glarea lozoyensis (strain ATCC 20868 / MF5171) TaxID=1116229 RepID=S3DDU4_GLAL2|nr:uncharacterized protein GLAREA_11379 [Glarea lozoyensis ATCC 20868]EPE24798.1 hypothetical protein GLAREA_11379 [Glarea lozoyensis ATCC 20868]
MNLLTSIVAFSSLLGAISVQACNADNCARAVSGTRAGAAFSITARADCSSFQKVTVTPIPVTSTTTTSLATSSPTTFVTQTVTTLTSTTVVDTYTSIVTTVIQYTFPPDRRRAADLGTGGEVPNPSSADMTKIERRQVTVVPSIVPTYASACSGSVRYQSACSCWGITPTTVTAATPTLWLSVVASTSVTVTIQHTTTATSVGTTLSTTTITGTTTAQPTACLASDNYGFKYGRGLTWPGPGQSFIAITYASFPIFDQEGCCQKCFSTPNCFKYFLPGLCLLYVLNSPNIASGTNICPAGVALEYTETYSLSGIGPCAVDAGMWVDEDHY